MHIIDNHFGIFLSALAPKMISIEVSEKNQTKKMLSPLRLTYEYTILIEKKNIAAYHPAK